MSRHLSTAAAYGLIAWRRVQQASQARKDRTLPYFWRDRPCPRCLAVGAAARSCDQTVAIKGEFFFDSHATVPEGAHVHRTCPACEFGWIELAAGTSRLSTRARQDEIRRLHAEVRQLLAEARSARKAMA